ncbi:MAG: glutamate--tRNA ligase family protein [Gemmatimonadaceae bacterium]|nr:glutamate--tRNA ligase family protein [Gemmatimonadaceae bacterium]
MTLAERLPLQLPAGFRTRFAPAPTGWLHLGHAVNAVWVWSIARAFGGRVLLRIEDHDLGRCRQEFEQGILDDLEWLDLPWDTDRSAPAGSPPPAVVRQRDREALYAAALARLDAQELVYPCRCSRREIARLAPHGDDEEPRYPGTCRDAALDPAVHAARRLRLAPDLVPFEDLVCGPQLQQPSRQCGDVLLRDRRGQWTYQFAVVVDDLAQEIDLIIRGTDLLASTGRQRLIAQALGASRVPMVLHHALVRHPDGAKLSKSRGDTALHELRRAGWTPARVLGHAAWLAGLRGVDAPLEARVLASLWGR